MKGSNFHPHLTGSEFVRAKRKTATRVKQVALSTLRNKLDRVFSEFIRRRDADSNGMGRCFTCNRWALLECSHFIPRQHTSVRWNELNAAGACSYCNRWGHGEQALFLIALEKKYGRPTVDALMELKHITAKFSRDDLNAMIEGFK